MDILHPHVQLSHVCPNCFVVLLCSHTVDMDIRVTTIYLPYQDLGKNRCLWIYKTDIRKEIFHNIAIYDQQDHLKIQPKSTKIAYLGAIFTFYHIKLLKSLTANL